jgi:predicted XRE-type DNA-binding protein
MSKDQEFKSVWDALEDDPVRAQNLKLRSALMIEIREKVNELEITQTQTAKVLCISQPRVSALLQGKIERFRLDSLVDMAHRLDLNVSIRLAS